MQKPQESAPDEARVACQEHMVLESVMVVLLVPAETVDGRLVDISSGKCCRASSLRSFHR